MTQEEKQLLLKDLCARLAYNPFCIVDGVESPVRLIRIEVDSVDGILLDFDYKDEQGLPLQVYLSEVKPYLRPLSSMTEDETVEFDKIKEIPRYVPDKSGISLLIPFYVDWLNANHLDYHELISRGLAIEAPEDMYKNI